MTPKHIGSNNLKGIEHGKALLGFSQRIEQWFLGGFEDQLVHPRQEADKDKACIKHPECDDGIKANKDSSDSRGP